MGNVEGWKTMPLGELLSTKNNKAKQIKSTEYSVVGTYPVVDQSSDFICGYNDDTNKLINTDLPLTIFGDHTRHTKFVDFPFIAGADGTQLLKPKRGIEDKFFYYLVSRAAEKIGNFGYDRHFKHLKEYICDYPVSKPEQAKIAKILSTVDRAIEETEALIAKQQRIKTGLMQDLLTCGIDEHGNLRTEQTHKFKDSPLGRIPVEWEVKALDSCVRNDGPICYGILMPGTGYDNGVPVIKVKDVVGGKIHQDNLLLTDPKIDNQYKRSKLRSGDLLITIRGTTGRVAIVPEELDGSNITQDTARIRLKEEYSNIYFYFLLQSMHVQDQVSLHTLGQAVKGINIAEVKNIFFGVPEINEQILIAEQLNQIEKSLVNTALELIKLNVLKTALMHDLLTGKKSVTEILKTATSN